VIVFPRKIRSLYDWRSQLSKSKLHTWDYVPAADYTYNEFRFVSEWPSQGASNSPAYQITDSVSHPDWMASLHGKPFQGDIGSGFFSQKSQIIVDFPYNQKISASVPEGPNTFNKAEYFGPVVAWPLHLIGYPTPTLRDLRPFGTTAIARCKPTNNVADLAVFLAELYSDGLPKLFGSTFWKEKVDLARSAGEEYLNVEFGWKPMISDIKDIVRAVTHAQDIINAYERGSGQMVRRRYVFPVEKTVSTTKIESRYNGFLPRGSETLLDLSKPGSDIFKQTTTWKQVWFSGAFTYHLPSDWYSRNALMNAGSKARTLLGLDLTPDVLWNAMPWSWAIDWFSNAGDVISNISDWSTDGLVLKYGYVMEHSFVTDRYFASHPLAFRQPYVYASPITAFVETKRREVATPFGFDVSWTGLSSRQLAISAALGLTKR